MTPEHAICRAMQYGSGTKVHKAYWDFLIKQYMIAGKCSQTVLDQHKELENKSIEEIFETYQILHSQWEQRKLKRANRVTPS